MLKGPDPAYALHLVHELGLYECIFAPPSPPFPRENFPEELPVHELSTATTGLTTILSQADQYLAQRLLASDHERYIAWNLAALTPWRDHHFPGADTKKSIPAAATAAREGLRITNKIHDVITASFRHYSTITDFVRDLNDKAVPRRGRVGAIVRKLGPTWKSQYVTALLREMNAVWPTTERQIPAELHEAKTKLISRIDADAEPNAAALEIMERYTRALKVVEEMGLMQCHEWTPVLNGSEVKEAVVGRKGKAGPWLAKALASVMEWQMDNDGGSAEQAREWVTANKERLVKGEEPEW